MAKLTTWQATVQDDDTGAAVVEPVVTVRKGGPAGDLADLFDVAGGGIGNPVTGGTDGFVQFQAYPGRYWIQAADGGTLSQAWYWDAVPDEGLNWASRADLVTDWAAGIDLPDGAVLSDGAVQYVVSAGATAISDLPGCLPFGPINILHWGVTTGTTLSGADSQPDDASKVQTAIEYCGNNGINEINWPAGYVNCGSPVNVVDRLYIVGEGARSSFLHCNHTSGEAIRFRHGYSGMMEMGVTAGAARRAAGAGSSRFGVRFEGDDIPEADANRMVHCVMENCYVFGHPDTLIYGVGPALALRVINCALNRTGRHGIHLERGTVSGRTNLITGFLAYATIEDCRFGSVDGHIIATGTDVDAFSTPALRVQVSNCEGSGNALNRDVMYADALMYLRGANHDVHGCGLQHPNATAFLAGRNLHFTSNRALGNGIENEFDPSSGVDTGSDVITITGHGYQNGYNVIYDNGGGTDIGGLVDGTEYYVINKTDDTFQLSATEGGAAIDLTSTGAGSAHTLTSKGSAVIVGTYDTLPTNGVWITGLSLIDPARDLEALVLATLPSGQTTEPRNIHLSYGETGNFEQVAATDSSMGSGGPNRIVGLHINGSRPTFNVKTDQVVNNSTSVQNISDLQVRVGSNETLAFELTLEFSGDTAADLRVDVNDPTGAVTRYGMPDSIKQNSSGTVVIEGSAESSDDINFGTVATRRLLTLTGVCEAGSSDGNLTPRFAQLVADASDTTVHAGLSTIRIWEVN